MITYSQWGVKVASSICIVFFCAMNTAFGQPSKIALQKKITLSVQNVPFGQILLHLTSQSKLYFIYSSNSVESNKLVSLDVKQQPLSEVLEMLSHRMNLTFRKEGNYIVVKRMTTDKNDLSNKKSFDPASFQASKKPVYSTVNVVSKELEADNTNNEIEIQSQSYQYSISSGLLRDNLLHCPLNFYSHDSLGFKKYTPLTITNPHPRRYVFTAIRFIANEYSSGLEIHVGIPSIYAVINAGMMAKGYLRQGFGLGTSIPVKKILSLNPIYTFAGLKQHEDYVIDDKLNLVIHNGLKMTGRHHQLKLNLQIPASKRVTFHVGPSFNILKTSYAYEKIELLLAQQTGESIVEDPAYIKPAAGTLIQRLYYIPPRDFSTLKFWVGFEVGAAYLIKFPRR